MWGQANSPEITFKTTEFIWLEEHKKENLEFDWDSAENIQRVQTRVQGLLKGCKCTKGCKTNACGCKRQGQSCTMGCQCNECVNLPQSVSQTQGIRGGKEGEHNTADYEDSESDSDASIDERQAKKSRENPVGGTTVTAKTKPIPSISGTAHAFIYACALQCAEGLHFSAFDYFL